MKANSEMSLQNARVLQAFCKMAEADPARSAVVSGGRSLSFGGVMDRARAIGKELHAAGVRPGVTVGAYLPRDLTLAPAVLGTWLAGGGYVPVDPAGPPGRVEYMLRDSQAYVVLAGPGGLPPGITAPAAEIILDSTGLVLEVRQMPVPAPAEPVSSESGIEDLAYVIYTSGTTGRPKGVLIGHAQVAAMATSQENSVYSGAGNFPNRVALNNVVTADSFFSDFVHLAFGRTIYIIDGDTRRDPERLGAFLLDNQIEVLDATPTQIRSVLLADQADALAALKVLIVGGEPTPPDLWRQIRALPKVQAFNMYGPTECAVAVTAGNLRLHAEPVIGTALEGCGVWVMDDHLCTVPDGIPGELVITGRQVGIGYLNPTPADSVRFVEVELPGSGQRVRGYRTGDRGYRNEAGQIVFLGRDDDQVSIGGHRVELGEIDVRIRDCPGVLDAAVGLIDQAGSATLTAWIVVSDATEAETVRAMLADQLPRHMIPVLNVVPTIPMGPTGKADLAKLKEIVVCAANHPEIPQINPGESQTLVALIRECWHEVLGAEGIDDDDDFFGLGGDSLKATDLIVRLRGVVDPSLPIRILFEHSRFVDFTAAVAGRTQGQR